LPISLGEIAELSTALGTVAPRLGPALRRCPHQLRNVSAQKWAALREAYEDGSAVEVFEAAFANGRHLLEAEDGLRGRAPALVEWKGPHRLPGDDAIPIDLRIDHVYLVSCKYLSKIVLNSGPARLFDRGLVGDERSAEDWFDVVAPEQLQAFYDAVVTATGLEGLPGSVRALTREHRDALRIALASRRLPPGCSDAWATLCAAVSTTSAQRWRASLPTTRSRLEMLWRMTRIAAATYFVLGASRADPIRLRVGSKWDWLQEFELRAFDVEARRAGQPEVAWEANVRRRDDRATRVVRGHVEIRWSHGRFGGFPEAKVYLDVPHDAVPGYHQLEEPELRLL